MNSIQFYMIAKTRQNLIVPQWNEAEIIYSVKIKYRVMPWAGCPVSRTPKKNIKFGLVWFIRVYPQGPRKGTVSN